MKILIVSYIRNKEQVNKCLALLDILVSANNKVDLRLTGGKNILELFYSYKLISDDDLKSSNKYDIILAYNKAGLGKAKKYTDKNYLPLIYVISANEITREYPDDFRSISKILLLNDYGNAPQNILPRYLTELFYLPISLKSKREYKLQNKKKPVILIDIESGKNSSSLYQIVPTLNMLTNFDINLLLSSKTFPKVFNSNIKVIYRNESIAHDMTIKADIVIGNGNSIKVGVGSCKPCIVIGLRGYGGIVSKINFNIQYKSNFQGRIGGELGEYVPVKVLMDEIYDIIEQGDEKTNTVIYENYELLKSKYADTVNKLHNLLKREIKNHKILSGNLNVARVILSKGFGFVPFSKNHFTIINILTRQKHSIIEKEEFEIINLFRKGNIVEDALIESGYEEQPELFIEFVKELVNEKILIIDV